MQLHLKMHGGFKPHICQFCGRAFGSKPSLRCHVRFNHLGLPKPFMCSVCGHTCGNKSELKRHEMTHTNEKAIYIWSTNYYILSIISLLSSLLNVLFATRNIERNSHLEFTKGNRNNFIDIIWNVYNYELHLTDLILAKSPTHVKFVENLTLTGILLLMLTLYLVWVV